MQCRAYTFDIFNKLYLLLIYKNILLAINNDEFPEFIFLKVDAGVEIGSRLDGFGTRDSSYIIQDLIHQCPVSVRDRHKKRTHLIAHSIITIMCRSGVTVMVVYPNTMHYSYNVYAMHYSYMELGYHNLKIYVSRF